MNQFSRLDLLKTASALAAVGLASRRARASGQNDDVWRIDSGPIDAAAYDGETLANGMIGIVTSPRPFRTGPIFINGAYEKLWAGSPSCLLRGFNFLDLDVVIDGLPLDSFEKARNFRQSLNLQTACFTTTFDFEDRAEVTYTLRALRHMPYSALLDVTVTAKRAIRLEVRGEISPPELFSGIDFGSGNEVTNASLHEVAHFQTNFEIAGSPPRRLRLAAAAALGPSRQHRVGAAHAFLFEDEAPALACEDHRLCFERKISGNGSFRFALVGATITSSHVADPVLEAQRLCSAALIMGKQDLINRHTEAWNELWKGRIELQGDAATQRDINSMLYHLYAFVREGSGYSIAPMGLSRGWDGYMGHIFWDAETWMLPVFLALNPALARTMLDYRFDRLEQAKRNAEAQGWRGARYPWESAATGDEDIWASAIHGTTEIHVTAAVGLAAWSYFRVTQDMDWLRAKGFPMIRATADFWLSRVRRNGPGRYDIDQVTGANEEANDVSNSAFTNAAAKENLAAATRAARRLGLEPDPDWEAVRANIPLFKMADGVTREHQGYEGGKRPVDIYLLSYPLEAITDPEQIRRDLEYSVARAKDWPEGMQNCVYAVLYQRLGRPAQAYRYFKASYINNRRPPFGVLTERSTQRNPYFATGAGGVLQAVIYGFGGLRITDAGLERQPEQLPAAWKSIRLMGVPHGP